MVSLAPWLRPCASLRKENDAPISRMTVSARIDGVGQGEIGPPVVGSDRITYLSWRARL